MSFEQTVVLSAIAGVTIFLGLPVGRLRNLSTGAQAILTTAAAGVVLFLIWDILAQAVAPVEASLDAFSHDGGPASAFVIDLAAFSLSISVGLLSVVWFSGRVRSGRTDATTSRELALGTAVGLALHNLSEGLAIGQSAATGATAFAFVLVIGFALHNATEGFGIAAPLTAGPRPAWRFLGGLGLLAGGPTFVGGVIGYSLVSPLLSIVFLGLAAGALIHVFNDMMGVSRRFARPAVANVALLVGLLLAFGTDFVLGAGGG